MVKNHLIPVGGGGRGGGLLNTNANKLNRLNVFVLFLVLNGFRVIHSGPGQCPDP